MGRRHGPRRLPTGLPPRPLPCISENAELMARCSAAPPFGCSSSLSPWPVGTEARCSRPLPACENEACSLSTHRKLHNARDSPSRSSLALLRATRVPQIQRCDVRGNGDGALVSHSLQVSSAIHWYFSQPSILSDPLAGKRFYCSSYPMEGWRADTFVLQRVCQGYGGCRPPAGRGQLQRSGVDRGGAARRQPGLARQRRERDLLRA